jgi:hypothetical protein
MELEAHISQLEERMQLMHEAAITMAETAERHTFFFGKFHPEVIGAEFKTAKEIGKSISSLVRLAPHARELYKLWQEDRQGRSGN